MFLKRVSKRGKDLLFETPLSVILTVLYRAPRNVVATFTQSVTRWHFRKAKFVQSCNIQFLNFFKRIC
jgi:hypothetical protein